MERVISVTAHPASGGAKPPPWARVGSHSHMFRTRKIPFEESLSQLLEWERRNGVAALGAGSPWTLLNAETYSRYEHAECDRYYAGKLTAAEFEDAIGRRDIEDYIETLNRAAGGRTLHYLDNETPKQRYGHMWHVGFALQVPAWHDYDQDRRASYCDLDPVEYPNPLDPRGVHVRRVYSEIVALQRAAGAISVWAHPTSWWFHNGRFTTNIASAMPPNLFADGFLDGITVQGYDAYHRDYQALWFELLDRGWRVPGFSELDLCPGCGGVEKASFFSCIPGISGTPTLDGILEAFRAARHSMSSGPYLTISADGRPQGSEVPSGAGTVHNIAVEAWPAPGEAALSHVELVSNGGRVIYDSGSFPGGTLCAQVEGDANGGWIVARAFGEGDGEYASRRQQATRHCAITNPVRLSAPHSPHPSRVRTEVSLRAAGNEGAVATLRTAAGGAVWSRTISAGGLEFDASPTDRLEISGNGHAAPRVLPLAAANRRVRSLMDYLSDGMFLRDFPGLEPGQVPVAAFRLDEYPAALGRMEIDA